MEPIKGQNGTMQFIVHVTQKNWSPQALFGRRWFKCNHMVLVWSCGVHLIHETENLFEIYWHMSVFVLLIWILRRCCFRFFQYFIGYCVYMGGKKALGIQSRGRSFSHPGFQRPRWCRCHWVSVPRQLFPSCCFQKSHGQFLHCPLPRSGRRMTWMWLKI